ncbi:replication protein [Escherichia coli]|nr:replication protein [Escherichia coli]
MSSQIKHSPGKPGRFTKHVSNGLSVPPVRRQLAAPKRPSGPTPIELLKQEYERRKAAGLV